MSSPVPDRTAPTDTPVLDVLAGRWSTRVFDASAVIDEEKLAAALEAARWAPSAYNSQPWRFIVARRGSDLHARVLSTLTPFNQAWAGNASVLIVALAETEREDGDAHTHALYDLGQAVAQFAVQAHHDGLVVHQMSGFDAQAVARFPEVSDRFTPMTAIAVGEFGSLDDAPEKIRERESAPRQRRPLTESLLANA